jgi:predicted Holliday junction resolvase-like endonuclease
MLENIYFALVIFIIILCLVILKGISDQKTRAKKVYLNELKIQEELVKSNIKNKHP